MERPLSSNAPDSPGLFISPFLASGLHPFHGDGQLGNARLGGSVGREAHFPD